MNGSGHRLLGMAFALEQAVLVNMPPLQAAVSVALAGVAAHGRTSPDIDQHRIWRGGRVGARRPRTIRFGPLHWRTRGRRGRRVRGLAVLFPRAMRGHRHLTHWWGWEAAGALALACAWVAATVLAPTLAPWWWLPESVLLGWTSHLAGDWLFGKAHWVQDGDGEWTCIQRAGIPMTPSGGHVGLGWFKVGGPVERATTAVLLPAVLAGQTWLLLGGRAVDVLAALRR